jgi:predicted nucleic acid-binding protein
MSAGKAFFDTNVLLYMYGAAGEKQVIAANLFSRHNAAKDLLLSTQVVQEFYAVASRKFSISREKLLDATLALLDTQLVIIGPTHIRSAIDIEQRYRISFWDALILAAAEAGGADVVYTEDLNDGQQYGTITVRNPFRPEPLS